MSTTETKCGWLLLLYQFASGPGSARVKVWRRLQAIGAVAIKNSVYVLPNTDQSNEDFAWLLQELQQGGADGAILESRFVDGMDDDAVRQLFSDARHDDYRAIRKEAAAMTARLRQLREGDDECYASARKTLRRLRKKIAEVGAIDFYLARGRQDAQRAIQELDEMSRQEPQAGRPPTPFRGSTPSDMLNNRVWVTRQGVKVDRIASAWLIRNWLDPNAVFKFVPAKGYTPKAGELRFDMFDAEYTHQGDLCTFEVLLDIADPEDDALRHIAGIVHDIDLKDGKFGHSETDGVASLLNGIVATNSDDESRLERGGQLFDDLYKSLSIDAA